MTSSIRTFFSNAGIPRHRSDRSFLLASLFGRRGTALAIAFVVWSSAALAAEPGLLRPGDRYKVASRSTLKGYLILPDPKDPKKTQTKRFAITGSARETYRERALAADADGTVDRAFRVYDVVSSERQLEDQPQEAKLRQETKRVVLYRRGNVEIPYSPDGPLLWAEIDLIRTHIFVPALESLIPKGDLKLGAQWTAPKRAVAELTGFDPLESGTLTCAYEGDFDYKGVKLVQVAFAGTVTGVTDEGRARDEIRGALYLEPAKLRLHSARAQARRQILDRDGAVVGELEVDYQMILRFLPETEESLTDAAVGTVPDQPSEEQTALFYEHPGLGIRMTHPRRWFLASVTGNQLLLTCEGAALVIHVEQDEKTPTSQAFFEEAKNYLVSKKYPMGAVTEPRERKSDAGRIGHFQFSATVDGSPTALEYYVVQRGKRGATFSARLPASVAEKLAPDIDAIARAVTFVEPAKPIPAADRFRAPGPAPTPTAPPRFQPR